MNNSVCKNPIFIVGTPRSGTTLLASMLNAHSNIDCGPETHFFCHLNKYIEKQIENKKKWPIPAVNYVCSIKLEDEFVYKLFTLSKREIFAFLKSRPPAIANVLESLTYLHAKRNNKNRWAEKTPRHLRFLSKIRKIYPEANIVRILRDPRDVALSLINVPWGYKHFLEGLYRCLEDEVFFELSEHCSDFYLLHYETLLDQPEISLAQLCKYLSEEFQEKMLYFFKYNTSLLSSKEWWKRNISIPLDPSRKFRWKEVLSIEDKRISSFFAYSFLKKYSYELESVNFHDTLFIFPLDYEYIRSNLSVFYRLSKRNIRLIGYPFITKILKLFEMENASILLLRLPLSFSMLGCYTRLSIIQTLYSFINAILEFKKMGVPVYYIYDRSKKIQSFSGKADFLLNRFVQTVAKEIPESLKKFFH